MENSLESESNANDISDSMASSFELMDLNLTNLTNLNNKCDNDTCGVVPLSLRPETYIVPILFAIIFIIGILGNGVLIAIFIKHKTMRNVPNMYIVSLAVGDLFVILFCIPFTSTVYTLESWPYGEFVCKFSEFIKDMSIGVSVFTLTALSADRYFAIADPMRKLHCRRATRITCVTIVGIWVLSIGLAIPSALFSYVRAYDQDPTRVFRVCYPFPPDLGDTYPQVMVMLHFLAYYAVPLAFIGTFYIIMARHLVLSTRNMPGEAQGQAKQMQGRRKVAKMILSFVVIFAICFFPSHLFLLWFYFDPEAEHRYNDFWHACRITGFCLSFINSCINPITLYCVSGTFRKQYNEHLFCCCCKSTRRGNQDGVRQAGFACGCSLSGVKGPGAYNNVNINMKDGRSQTQIQNLNRNKNVNLSGSVFINNQNKIEQWNQPCHSTVVLNGNGINGIAIPSRKTCQDNSPPKGVGDDKINSDMTSGTNQPILSLKYIDESSDSQCQM